MKRLRKLLGWVALAAMVLLGLAAGLFIKGCGGRPAPRPSEEGASPTSKPRTGDRDGTAIDRTEVEQGQPLPRNYVE